MSIKRRDFLGMAGVAAVALAARSSFQKLSRNTKGGGGAHGESESTGTRWAMVIDPGKCLKSEGCTACTDACHKNHNVPEMPEKKHEIEWIWKESFDGAFPDQGNAYTEKAFKDKPVLVFCNNCDNPPCVRVCPTKATWKREDGVVMMDWHRCIGCRYCMAACPYGSRSFNWLNPRPHIEKLDRDYPTRMIGVVEKCTFCEERDLAKGEKPACVEACPDKALVFGDLNEEDGEVRKLLRSNYTIRRKPQLGTKPEIFYIV
jgi:Fe-S-cluster-containing dehydrogenase component